MVKCSTIKKKIFTTSLCTESFPMHRILGDSLGKSFLSCVALVTPQGPYMTALHEQRVCLSYNPLNINTYLNLLMIAGDDGSHDCRYRRCASRVLLKGVVPAQLRINSVPTWSSWVLTEEGVSHSQRYPTEGGWHWEGLGFTEPQIKAFSDARMPEKCNSQHGFLSSVCCLAVQDASLALNCHSCQLGSDHGDVEATFVKGNWEGARGWLHILNSPSSAVFPGALDTTFDLFIEEHLMSITKQWLP